MGLEVRRARWQDQNAISDFVAEAYGDQAAYKGRARWQWQFVDNPFREGSAFPPPVWIACDRDRVIGQVAVQEGALQVKGRKLRAGWIVDVMILPEYRGRRLGHRLHDAVAAENDILVTLTMASATRRIVERAGAITLGKVNRYSRWLRLSDGALERYVKYHAARGGRISRVVGVAFDRLRLNQLAPRLVNPMLALADITRRDHPAATDLEIVEVDVFGADIDDLWERTRHEYPAIFARDRSYLNWRFVTVPQLDYRKFVARRSGRAVGLVVTRRCTPVELPFGIIAELYGSRHDSAVLAALLRHAIAQFGGEVASIQIATSIPEIDQIVKRQAFLKRSATEPTVVCRNPEIGAELLTLKDDWFFSKGDHDWDQIEPV
jgi:hypothetical protein